MSPFAHDLKSWVPALGWALAHFLWQGALVGLVLQVLLKTCRTARARHDLALGGLVLMALLPVVTFVWLRGDVRIVRVPAGFPGLDGAQGLRWETAAVAAWLSGVAALAIRTAGGLVLVERLRRTATPLPAAWTARCEALHRRMTGSLAVIFAQSEAIATPLVAGWLKPMVLIPAAALVRLPADQLEALILHELAHVRRLDALANLIQTVVETLLFYHPAIWWLSRRIRIEREHCCDDLAVAAVEDPALYVRALRTLDLHRGSAQGVLAANGGDLKARAARILGLAAAPARPALSRTAAMLILTAPVIAMTHSVAVQAMPTVAPAAPAHAHAAMEEASPVVTAVASSQPQAAAPAPILVLAEADAAPPMPTAPVQPPAPALAPQSPGPSPMQVAVASAAPPALPTVPVAPAPPVAAKPPAAVITVAGDYGGVRNDTPTIWPSLAYQTGAPGQVRLSCLIDVHGLAERCQVASETPRGKGFGAAALELRPTLKLAPAIGPDGAPTRAVMAIEVDFKAPGNFYTGSESHVTLPGTPLPLHRVTMLNAPIWTQAAGFEDLARAYPAKGGGAEGYAVAQCRVETNGRLTTCSIVKEVPENRGFAEAALSLVGKFKVAPQMAVSHHFAPLEVDVPIRMPPPQQVAERAVTAPTWISGVDPQAAPKVFPPEAVANGMVTGRGVARCVVGADGGLTQCAPEAAEPSGFGFSEAAAKLASTMKMNLWSADGGPVEGGVVHVPVRLNLKGG
jgi:TonB family protein